MNTDRANITPEEWVSARFRDLRKERGWSQEDLARHMAPYGRRWSQATVTRLEAASRPIRLNEVADLAALFGLKLSEALAGAPERTPACAACGNEPPAGFTCNTCGNVGTGPVRIKQPAKKPAFIEVCGAKVTKPMAFVLATELLTPGKSLFTRSDGTEAALVKRGLLMRRGDCGPHGNRLTVKGKEVGLILAQEHRDQLGLEYSLEQLQQAATR